MNAAQIVTDALNVLTLGPATTIENLTMLPLLASAECVPDYLTLDEALASGHAQVTETSESGTVAELKIANSGASPVLLLDGEELIGAKQNRIVNLTILVPPQRSIVIPVSCVEAGRWRHVSKMFASSPRTHFAEGRAAKTRHVTASLMTAGSRASNQHEVWRQIAEKSARFNVASATSAMSAMYDNLDASLERFTSAFAPGERQVGAIFLINGRPAGLDLFDAPSTWRKLSPKLVRSYAVDAIDRREKDASPSGEERAQVFKADTAETPASVFPAIGDGEDVRLAGSRVAGAALVVHGRAIHVSAFPVESV